VPPPSRLANGDDRTMTTAEKTTQGSAQLWIGEQQTLYELSRQVPAEGTIVEIGTAQGGSARIFEEATRGRDIKIYSFDIEPSSEAYANLKDTSVMIVAKASVEGAAAWAGEIGAAIDLLFIDGSHLLRDVFHDFNAWVRWLRPGGRIVFHDYDSRERGGLKHLGVQVVVDAILRSEVLESVLHVDRIVHGVIERPQEAHVTAGDCYAAMVGVAEGFRQLAGRSYSDWRLVGDDRFAAFLKCCLEVDSNPTIAPSEARDPKARYLVFARPLTPALEALREIEEAGAELVTVNSLQACYLLARALRRRRDYLLTIATPRSDFFAWEELLSIFEHATQAPPFPETVPELAVWGDVDVEVLSRTCAHEHVRLSILSNLLKTCTGLAP